MRGPSANSCVLYLGFDRGGAGQNGDRERASAQAQQQTTTTTTTTTTENQRGPTPTRAAAAAAATREAANGACRGGNKWPPEEERGKRAQKTQRHAPGSALETKTPPPAATPQ